MSDKLVCFLPCRKGSERVPKKNIKQFANYENGLVELKLNQLINSKRVDEVVLSTNDDDILNYANTVRSGKLRIVRRDDVLASSTTSTDELVAHALDICGDGHIMWTHVTSPFITANRYDEVIESYFTALANGYDSLMTTTELYAFLWSKNKPLNYDRSIEKWPRTQTLTPVHEVNSGAFIAPSEVYREQEDRVGSRPFLHVLDKLTAHDVDWPEDFVLAECIAREKLAPL